MLLTPLVAMQFTRDVSWDETDFIVAGIMLFGACGAYELAAKATGNTAYRAAAAVAIVAALALVWINLAVGIIGTEDNPANVMYGGVLAIGIIGAFASRFQPQGMALALIAMAIAQAAVAAIALIAGSGSIGPSLGLTGVFAVLWLISAWLFRKAARQQMSMRAAVAD